jgi:hypothetical protein
MRYIIILISILAFIINCSSPSLQTSGNIIIKTPSVIYPPMKNIVTSGSQINPDTLSQSQFRYEVIVESNGKRLLFSQFKNDTEKTIAVPTGIPLDIKVGVYYAKNNSTMDEAYNAYLAAASVNNVSLMSGESKNIELKLDMNKQLRVDSYFDATMDISRQISITGGINAVSTFTIPTFSYYPLNGALNAKSAQYDGTTFRFTSTANIGFGLAGKGMYADVSSDPGFRYWYIESTGIHKSTFGNGSFTNTPTSTPLVNYIYPDVFSIKSVYIPSASSGTNYFYFLNYKDGFVAVNYNGSTLPYWYYANNDFSEYKYLYPGEPFLEDVQTDMTNFKWAFFATKIGLYYLNDATLAKFAPGSGTTNKNAALAGFYKNIRISNPSGGSILITKVEDTGSEIYLGTRQGLYYINKNSSEWQNFVNAPNTSGISFTSITKISDFTEPVISMDYSPVIKILSVSTPKRIWFKNTVNGRTDTVTEWDGLPLVPIFSCINAPVLNSIDFKTHDLAPVKFVMWDNVNSRFWIGTNYGLASIAMGKLNL